MLTIILAFVLPGCGGLTVRQLKDNPAKSVHFEVNENYQAVYKRVKDRMHECFGEPSYPNLSIRSEVLQEMGEAQITYSHNNLGVVSALMHIDIKKKDNSSLVDAFIYYKTWGTKFELLQNWITNKDLSCELKASKKVEPMVWGN